MQRATGNVPVHAWSSDTTRSDTALMFAPSCHRFLALAALFVSGCFAELSGDPDPTSEQSCIPGTVACQCYGNGTCDPELECVPEISACVPMNCVAGTEQCICDAGACAQDLECLEGLCIQSASESSSSGEPDDETTGTSSDPSSSSGNPTSSPSTTEDPSTSTTVDPSTSTTSESESESDTETDSGDPACHEMTCGDCVQCVTTQGNDCEDEAAACTANVGCGVAAQCLANCNLKGLCFDNCCEGVSPAAAAAAIALNACRADRCATTCNDYVFGQCA
jgi:hypothetical protein